MNDGRQTVLVADSCAGGTATLRSLLEKCPECDFVYLCDGEMNPFGVKPRDVIVGIVRDWLRFATVIGARVLVIACNTASAAVADCRRALEKEFSITIVTMLDAAENAFRRHQAVLRGGDVALFGTRFTVESHVYDPLLADYAPRTVHPVPGTRSERVVARNLFGSREDMLQVERELAILRDGDVRCIVLVCTCFEFLVPVILSISPGIFVINLNDFLAHSLPERMMRSSDAAGRRDIRDVRFLTTGDPAEWSENMNAVIRLAYGIPVEVEKVEIRRR